MKMYYEFCMYQIVEGMDLCLFTHSLVEGQVCLPASLLR